MFRFNLENNEVEIKATLYKNRREKIGIIDQSWIKKISRQLEEVDYMEIEIPKHIGDDKRINSIYFKINPMQQIILEETNKMGEVVRSRFVVTEPNSNTSKYTGVKRFKAYSFENKLLNKRTQFEGKVMQLISDDVHIGEGVLNKFTNECKDWTIGYVDPKSRIETRMGVENVNVNLFDNYTNNKVTEGSVIWQKDVSTSIGEGLPLYLSIEYKALKTYDESGKLLVTNNIINQVTEPLYGNIRKIIARHHSEVGNRFSIEYEFILADNVSTRRVLTFTNVIDKKINCDNIKLVWETGKIIENSNIKYINIESIDDNWLKVIQDLAQQFNSIVLFDSYKKEVSVIHKDNLGKNSGYLLSYDSNVVDVDVSESSSYPNCLKVIGKDGLSIQSENIFGGDVIYDYTYYINNKIMSEELSNAWTRYEKYLATRQEEYLVLKNERMTIQQRKTKLDSEIKSLNERIKNLNNLLAAYIAQGGSADQERVKAEMEQLKTRLEECLSDRSGYQNSITALDDEIVKLSSDIKQENASDSAGKIFTDLDLEELRELEVMESYSDEYYSTPYGLISHAKNILSDRTKPEIEFNINCENLAKIIRNPKGWNKVLYLGDLFNLEDGLIDNYKEDSVRLISYDYIPETKTVSNVTFGNKFKKVEISKTLSNIGKKTNDSANVLGTFKEIFDDVKTSTDWVQGVIDGGLDLNAQYIRGKGMRNYIDISEAGIFIIDQTDTNKQIYLGSSCIGLTQTGFASSDIAISSDGIWAKHLIGEIILGKTLYITSELGEFYIGNMNDVNKGFGMSILDDSKTQRIFIGTELENGVRKAKFRLISKTGRELVISEDGIVQHGSDTISDNLDSAHPMYMYIPIDDGTFEIRKVKLKLKLEKYRAFEKGIASSGRVQTSSSGGGFSVTETSSGGGSYEDTVVRSSEGQKWHTVGDYVPCTSDESGGFYLELGFLNHNHEVSVPISIPSHSHAVSVSQKSHSHDLDFTHQHELQYGIFEDSMPSNVSVYINGRLAAQNINSDVEIDVTSHLEIGRFNEVRITSGTNGRIVACVFQKLFVGY